MRRDALAALVRQVDARGGEMLLPAGTYRLDGTLRLERLTLRGVGNLAVVPAAGAQEHDVDHLPETDPTHDDR